LPEAAEGIRMSTRASIAPTDSKSATPATCGMRRGPAYVPNALSGNLRPATFERALVTAGLAKNHTAAKALIRDLPRQYARFLELGFAVADRRMSVITKAPEAVMEASEAAVLCDALEVEETQIDGREDETYLAFKHAPSDQTARAAAHDCFRAARIYNRKGRAILRHQGLAL
jgi:hypothetical protein